MTLLFHDGFDAAQAGTFTGWADDTYQAFAGWHGGTVQQSYPGRTGTGTAARAANNLTFFFPADLGTVIVGLAQMYNAVAGEMYLIRFHDGTNWQLTVVVDRDYRKLRVYGGAQGVNLLGESAVVTAMQDQWDFWEFKVVFDATVGSVEIRKNGNPTPLLNLTGVNTAPTGNAWARYLQIGANTFQHFDDVYVCDTAGAVNNNFLGDVSSQAINPDADGALEQWTRSTGADSWALVDESPMNYDTDYIESGTNGHITRFLHTDVATGDTIKGVTHTAVVKKTDAALAGLRLHQFVGGVDYMGSIAYLGTSYVGVRRLLELNPNTAAAWTPAGLNASELGVEAVI